MSIYDEEWRPIAGYEGLYAVSNMGRIKSLPRDTGNQYRERETILKLRSYKTGYRYVNLYKDHKMKSATVHRLVTIAFIPNPDNLPCVNHKAENKGNNCVWNLEWCSKKYNNIYGSRIKAIANKLTGRTNTKSSKTVLQYDRQGNLIQKWPSTAEIQRQLGIPSAHISMCCHNKIKTARGYVWRYL